MSSDIKHIVLSACGPNIVTMLGTICQLFNDKYIDMESIESFYAASAGSIISVLLLLADDLDMLRDYVVKRPWNTVWPIDPNSIFGMYKKTGLFNIDDFFKAFEPFFLAKNIDKDITLLEFYEINHKSLYLYVAELNNYEVFYVNHESHPDLKLVEAVYMSCAIPILFSPLFKDDKCYFDGGLLNYFPTCDVIKKADQNSILGICNNRSLKKKSAIKPDTNFLEYITTFFMKNVDYTIDILYNKDELNNIVYIPGFDNNNLWLSIINNQEVRAEKYELGCKTAKDFLATKRENEDLSVTVFNEELHESTPPNAP